MISELLYMWDVENKLSRSPLRILLAALSLVWLPTGPVRAAELVMFERDGCVWCLRWNREIGSTYDQTNEGRRLPLRRLKVAQSPDFELAEPVRYTPTFVVVENGRETGRITGYPGADAFWGLLGKLMPENPGSPAPVPQTPALQPL